MFVMRSTTTREEDRRIIKTASRLCLDSEAVFVEEREVSEMSVSAGTLARLGCLDIEDYFMRRKVEGRIREWKEKEEASRRILQSWGTWIQSLEPWRYFVTLTFKEESQVTFSKWSTGAGVRLAWGRFKRWQEHLNDLRKEWAWENDGKEGEAESSHFTVLEKPEYRVLPHIHSLVGGSPFHIGAAHRWASKEIGVNKIQFVSRSVYPEMGKYIGKYLLKNGAKGLDISGEDVLRWRIGGKESDISKRVESGRRRLQLL